MAIVQMKKLRLLAVRDQKEELLKELIRHGCVEFSELEGELQGTELESALHRENPDLTALRARHTTLNHAIELLNVYAPKKSKLLSAKPELEPQVLLDDTGLTGALKTAEAIEGYDARIKRIAAEESRERSTIEALRPWQELDLPLDCEGTERCGVLLGTVPARMDLGQMNAALDAVDEESELFTIREEKKERYVLLVCMKDKLAAMQDALRPFGFTPSAVAGMSGTARECMLNAEQTLKELAAEKENCTRYIVDDAVHRDELKLAADRVSVQIALAEAEDRLCSTDKVLVMEGWIPAEKEKELGEVFDRFGCAWEAVDPAEDEYPRVPVQLKNNKFTNALNMVTNMYSLPAYGSRDPNPLMAPFFILFYGLMMADMGYGIIMIIAALVAMKKIKPRGGTLAFCQLLLYGGISTFVMGALTGGFFGNAPEIIAGMFGSTWKGLPYLFSPVRDSNMVLRQLPGEVAARRQGRRHLRGGLPVGHPGGRRTAGPADADLQGRGRAAHGGPGGDHRGRRDAALRLHPRRHRLRQDHGPLLLPVQHAHGLVRRRAELLAYHGADAGGRRCGPGVQHHRGHALEERSHPGVGSDLYCGLPDRPRAELRAEPAGLLCARPETSVPGVLRQVLSGRRQTLYAPAHSYPVHQSPGITTFTHN